MRTHTLTNSRSAAHIRRQPAAAVLVSDFMEGIARGILTNEGIGPFFAEVGNYLRANKK